MTDLEIIKKLERAVGEPFKLVECVDDREFRQEFCYDCKRNPCVRSLSPLRELTP